MGLLDTYGTGENPFDISIKRPGETAPLPGSEGFVHPATVGTPPQMTPEQQKYADTKQSLD